MFVLSTLYDILTRPKLPNDAFLKTHPCRDADA